LEGFVPKVLVLVRHGKPNYESDRRELSDEGKRQAHETACVLARKGIEPDIILCSPILRARQTAEVLAETFAASKLIEDKRLREVEAEMDVRRGIRAAIAGLDETRRTAFIVSHKDLLAAAAMALTGQFLAFDYAQAEIISCREGSWNEIAASEDNALDQGGVL
jgi:phosphohistidine phosphatase SixA